MGKKIRILLGASIVGMGFLGWCTGKGNIKINEQKEKITGLEIKANEDSLFIGSLKDNLGSLKENIKSYSDSLDKTSNLYHQSLLENKKLNQKFGGLAKRANKDSSFEGLEEKYTSLVNKYNALKNAKGNYSPLKKDEYDALKNERDTFFGLYQKEISKNKELTSLLKEKGEKDASSGKEYSNSQSSKETKKKYNAKNQNLFRNWEFLSPKLFSVGEESVSFKDNDPKDMEAFAIYNTGRLIPLKKLEETDKCSSFYFPYIDFDKGTIAVYAIDKHKNKSSEYTIHISGGVVSKKKF